MQLQVKRSGLHANLVRQILELIDKNITPSKIMTQNAFENAVAVDMALGGSSNTTLHVPAIAYELVDNGVFVDLRSLR